MYVVAGVSGNTGSVFHGEHVRHAAGHEGPRHLPSFFDPEKKMPMVATRDIGEAAVRAPLGPPGETQVIELAGPTEHSLADAARAYSRAMGKQSTATRVPDEGIAPLLVQAGISPSVAELAREMPVGIEKGIVNCHS